MSGARGQGGESLDRLLGAAHREVLESVPEAKQEQQQRPFRPGSERRGAGCGHQHQGVDLETLAPQVPDSLADREPAAQGIGDQEKAEWQPSRHARNEFLDQPANRERDTAADREDELCVGSEEAGMTMVVPVAFGMTVVMAIAIGVTMVVTVIGRMTGLVIGWRFRLLFKGLRSG